MAKTAKKAAKKAAKKSAKKAAKEEEVIRQGLRKLCEGK